MTDEYCAKVAKKRTCAEIHKRNLRTIIRARLCVNLRKFRKSRVLSQLSLARMLGVSRVTISNMERGKRNISAEDLFLLSDILDINKELFYEEILL